MDLGSHGALSYALRNSRIWEKKKAMTLQPYYLLPIKPGQGQKAREQPWAVSGPLYPMNLLLGKPLRSSPHFKMQYQTKPSAKDPSLRGKQYKTNSAGGDINWYVLHGGQYRGISGYYKYYKCLPTRPHLSVLQMNESVQPAISFLGVCLRYTRNMGNMTYTQDIPRQHYCVSTRLETIRHVPG